MDKIILLAVFTSIILFSVNSQVFAEPNEKIDISKYVEWSQYTNGKSPDTADIIHSSKIIFEIGKHKDVHVKHIIEGMAWGPEDPKVLKTLPGKHSNLEVTDEDGDYLRPIGFVGETFEESEYVILGLKTFGGFDLVMEYDLENFLELKENGMWSKNFQFPHDVEIYLDEDIEIVFANSRPIDVSVAKGINCVGCDLLIEFFDKRELSVEKVMKYENKFEEVSNTGEEFILEMFSDGSITNLNYIEELNYFSFSVNKDNQLVLAKIPLDLLLSPYHVYSTENDQEVLTEGDGIRKKELNQTETHTNLSFIAPTKGVIHVVGATEMEHKELLEQLEKMKPPEPEKSSKPDSLSDILRGDFENEKEELEEEQSNSLYENWGENKTSTSNDNAITWVIFVIIGIVTVIIIGIIIKLKKN